MCQSFAMSSGYTYMLNWAKRTSWGWWDEWDDTALWTQDSKLKPWMSEAEHAPSRSQRLPTIQFYEWMGKKHFCYFQIAETGKRTLAAWKAAVLSEQTNKRSIARTIDQMNWLIEEHQLQIKLANQFMKIKDHEGNNARIKGKGEWDY